MVYFNKFYTIPERVVIEWKNSFKAFYANQEFSEVLSFEL